LLLVTTTSQVDLLGINILEFLEDDPQDFCSH